MALLGGLIPGQSWACGLNWKKPSFHFDGVDSEGHVYLVQELDKLESGSGPEVPLRATFQSERTGASPYAGTGWSISFLESNITQMSEDGFKMVLPDGNARWFWRDKQNPNLLHGSGGNWLAEIQGPAIVAWAECGTKLTFRNGKIVSFQTGTRTFTYNYVNNAVDEVRMNGESVLRVESESLESGATRLVLPGGRVTHLTQSERPLVQSVNGTKLIGGTVRSLGKIARADGSVSHISYGVEEALNPTLQAGERLIVWTPDTQRVLKDGEWTYEAKLPERDATAKIITRKNTEGKMELWSYDPNKGEEMTQTLDGSRETTRWFTSGILIGKTRMVDRRHPDGRFEKQSTTYDERGRILRCIEETEKGSSTLVDIQYAADGSMRSLTDRQGFKRFYVKEKNGRVMQDLLSQEAAAEFSRWESVLKESIEHTSDAASRNEALRNLAAFYVETGAKPARVVELSQLVTDPIVATEIHSLLSQNSLKSNSNPSSQSNTESK